MSTHEIEGGNELRIRARQKWGSVRKVRFKSQIFEFFRFASVHDGKPFSINQIRNLIAKDRIRRETLRMRVTQRVRRSIDKINVSKGDRYIRLATDNLAFAKNVGIFDVVNGKVKSGEEAKKIASFLETGSEDAVPMIIRLLLMSKYTAYIGFLMALQQIGGSLIIPGKFSGRTKASNLSNYLEESGFKTDPASFYTIRDLFYEFELINWRKDPLDGSELIFLTSFLSESPLLEEYEKICTLNSLILCYSKSLTFKEFGTCVVNEYLNCTKGKWGKTITILDLRDRVTESLRISDSQFNRMIVELTGKWCENHVKVTLSRGVVRPSIKSGYLIKAINLPIIHDGRTAEYLRLYKTNIR